MANVNNNPFTASFVNPWPTLLPEPAIPNTDFLFKYLAYHAAASANNNGTVPLHPGIKASTEIYPWMRESHPANNLVVGGKRPFHHQSYSDHPTEGLTSPISPEPTPPISLSPGKLMDELVSLSLFASLLLMGWKYFHDFLESAL